MRSAPQVAYVIWILVSTVGLLQALASYYRWFGLSFFRHRLRLGYVCAALLVPVSCFWFFSLTNRNVEGLEGWQLFSRFVIGVAGGVLVVLLLSSFLNRDMAGEQADNCVPPDGDGLDGLRYDTYVHLLGRTLRSAWLVQQRSKEEKAHG